MKFRLAIIFTVLTASFLCAGCKTVGTTTAGGTNTTPVISVESATKAAAVFKSTVRSATLLAITKDRNAKAYLQAGAGVIGLVISGSDYSPDAISTALGDSSIKELHTVESQLAINTFIGFYEAFYADRVKANVDENVYARIFLVAAYDGINAGIADASKLQ